MPTIKFSYPFKKLASNNSLVNQAKLLQVIPVNLEDITQELRDFDTDFGRYPLPAKGKYLMLIFQKSHYDLFTTLRRDTPEKQEYYLRSVGQVFDLDIHHETQQ